MQLGSYLGIVACQVFFIRVYSLTRTIIYFLDAGRKQGCDGACAQGGLFVETGFVCGVIIGKTKRKCLFGKHLRFI